MYYYLKQFALFFYPMLCVLAYPVILLAYGFFQPDRHGNIEIPEWLYTFRKKSQDGFILVVFLMLPWFCLLPFAATITIAGFGMLASGVLGLLSYAIHHFLIDNNGYQSLKAKFPYLNFLMRLVHSIFASAENQVETKPGRTTACITIIGLFGLASTFSLIFMPGFHFGFSIGLLGYAAIALLLISLAIYHVVNKIQNYKKSVNTLNLHPEKIFSLTETPDASIKNSVTETSQLTAETPAPFRADPNLTGYQKCLTPLLLPEFQAKLETSASINEGSQLCNLPTEVVSLILTFVPDADLIACEMTCRLLFVIINSHVYLAKSKVLESNSAAANLFFSPFQKNHASKFIYFSQLALHMHQRAQSYLLTSYKTLLAQNDYDDKNYPRLFLFSQLMTELQIKHEPFVNNTELKPDDIPAVKKVLALKMKELRGGFSSKFFANYLPQITEEPVQENIFQNP